MEGWKSVSQVVLVDQSPLGKTPRSNPGVYTGAFDDIRELFAQSEGARQRGLNASAFSFNSAQGQCERCRGAGFEKIEMQFLSDVFIRCPDCNGRRYRPHILEVTLPGPARSRSGSAPGTEWSIADVLEATVDEVAVICRGPGQCQRPRAGRRPAWNCSRRSGWATCAWASRSTPCPAARASASSWCATWPARRSPHPGRPQATPEPRAGALFLFDEPTTGLHFDDVRLLLQVFQRLVDAGHSVVVVEHNLDVIKCADWIIDLGPDAGEEGGRLVAQGPPETVAACRQSLTGRWLRGLIPVAGKREKSCA